MKTRFFAAPALALFAVLFAQAASAEGITTEAADSESNTDSATAMFKKLDANNDGYISAAEAQASPDVEEAFGEGDTNGDGQLSLDEFVKMEVGGE
jgi:Ca2+-binding EF-hand superfamily protein